MQENAFTLSRFHAFTLSRFHAFTLSRFHAFTLSRFHAFTLERWTLTGYSNATMLETFMAHKSSKALKRFRDKTDDRADLDTLQLLI